MGWGTASRRVATLARRRWPFLAAGALLIVHHTAAALGLSTESPALLPLDLFVGYALGRHTTGRVAPAVTVALVVLAAVGLPGVGPPDLLFVLVVLGGAATFGRLVGRRTAGAQSARVEYSTLRRTDPGQTAARAVRDERTRLAREAVEVISTAVREMDQAAAAAEADLDHLTLRRIRQRGTTATHELRELLALLRDRTEPPPSEEAEPAEDPGPSHRHWLSMSAVGPAGVIGLLAVFDAVAATDPPQAPVHATTSLMWCLAVALRQHAPTAACLVAILPVALASALPTAAVGTGSPEYAELVALALLSWAAATRGAWFGLALLAAVVVGAVLHDGSGNLAIDVALLGVPAFAGHAWQEREREQRRSEALASALRSDIDRTVQAAITSERLRIARELHDVTSHAVGAMMLQGSAAESLATRDPGRAREALQAVRDAAGNATAELAVLGNVLDIEEQAEATTDPAGLSHALDALTAPFTAAGTPVRMRVHMDTRHPDPESYAVLLRVAREALTNAARHAPGAALEVSVTDSGSGVDLLVTNGPARIAPALAGTGFGLMGLHERVQSVGGELTAGPCAGGGFRVAAHLPDRNRPSHQPAASRTGEGPS